MLDCVIVGVNEQNFDSNAKRQKTLNKYSGSYEEILTNSILMDGKYYTSIELMNFLLREIAVGDVYWKNHMIQNVNASILLPLHSSGIWALPYLFEKGITLDFFMSYSKLVSDIIKDNVANDTFKTKEQILQRFQEIKRGE